MLRVALFALPIYLYRQRVKGQDCLSQQKEKILYVRICIYDDICMDVRRSFESQKSNNCKAT